MFEWSMVTKWDVWLVTDADTHEEEPSFFPKEL